MKFRGEKLFEKSFSPSFYSNLSPLFQKLSNKKRNKESADPKE